MNSRTPVNKILILAASPKDMNRVRLEDELRDIEEVLQRARKREQFEVKLKLAVRYRDIRQALLDFDPQIVHFSGHGEGEGGLVFEDGTGKAKLVDAEALAELFDLFKHVKCVVLNACYSENQAEAIVQLQHIDYVIGMSQAIGDRAAIEFAVGFYDGLGAGRSFEDAYKFGKNAIHIASIPEHLTPKLLRKKQFETEGANTTASNSGFSNDDLNYDPKKELSTKVFLSYSPKDEKLRIELENSLSILEGEGVISIWHDGKIRAGRNRNLEINKNLNSARIILLLISRHFIASLHRSNFEVKQAIERQSAGEAHVIPVLLSPVAGWQSIKFNDFQLGNLQYLPRNGKFVTDSRFWKNQNEAFVKIAEEFAEAVEQIAAESP
ncbi:MAG: CHAT domain-containing protein [Spirirestis rafaelensis WJT71-NPBG6]|jgi:hypothetical protein|nr:CHAT domain-containing protein [Spirirestis rafaelensis WJT71-NPBG6]